MLYRTLSITGHVKNAPDRVRPQYYSWPRGAPVDIVRKILEGYTKAFDGMTYKYTAV